MKNAFFIIILLVAVNGFSQPSEMDKLKSTNTDSLTLEIEKSTASLDSVMDAHNQWMQAEARHRDSLSNIRNLEWFMAERKEQERKQTRNLIIRGSLLGVGIVLAVAGNIRRRRIAKKDKM